MRVRVRRARAECAPGTQLAAARRVGTGTLTSARTETERCPHGSEPVRPVQGARHRIVRACAPRWHGHALSGGLSLSVARHPSSALCCRWVCLPPDLRARLAPGCCSSSSLSPSLSPYSCRAPRRLSEPPYSRSLAASLLLRARNGHARQSSGGDVLKHARLTPQPHVRGYVRALDTLDFIMAESSLCSFRSSLQVHRPRFNRLIKVVNWKWEHLVHHRKLFLNGQRCLQKSSSQPLSGASRMTALCCKPPCLCKHTTHTRTGAGTRVRARAHVLSLSYISAGKRQPDF